MKMDYETTNLFCKENNHIMPSELFEWSIIEKIKNETFLEFHSLKDPGYPCAGIRVGDKRTYVIKNIKIAEEEIIKVKKVKPNKFHFGKYKGHLVSKIQQTDTGYINWCIENIPNFEKNVLKIKKENITINK